MGQLHADDCWNIEDKYSTFAEYLDSTNVKAVTLTVEVHGATVDIVCPYTADDYKDHRGTVALDVGNVLFRRSKDRNPPIDITQGDWDRLVAEIQADEIQADDDKKNKGALEISTGALEILTWEV